MKRFFLIGSILFLSVLSTGCGWFFIKPVETGAIPEVRIGLVPERAEGATLRVASFNILYGTKSSQPWTKRSAAVIEHLLDLDPDIFGLQEALWFQIEDTKAAFPEHTCVARGRDDGLREGEAMALFFRSDRFTLHTAETFWLSDTPEVAGSNTWGAACNRCATVAILIDRNTGKVFGVCNTHFDHVSQNARDRAAELIARRLPTYGEGLPWIVNGDFNSTPGSKPYETLAGENSHAGLLDTMKIKEPIAPLGPSTFHGYTGDVRENNRIDWILTTSDFEVLGTGIGQYKYQGIYPSDHFSIWADLSGPK